MDFIGNKSNKIINNNSLDDKNNLLNDEINKLKNRIKQLETELNNEKEKNKKLNEQIRNYKKNRQDLNEKLSGNNSIDNNKILELEKIIATKTDEINVLKSRLNDNKINNFEKITLYFYLKIN